MDKSILQPHWERWLLLKEPGVHGVGQLQQDCEVCSYAVFLEGTSCERSLGHSRFAHLLHEVNGHLYVGVCLYKCSEVPVLSSPSCTVPVVLEDERVQSHF